MKVRSVSLIFVSLVLWLAGCRQEQPAATAIVPPTDTPAPAVSLTSSPTELPAPTATHTPSPTKPPAPSGWIGLESGESSHLTAVECLDNDTCLVVGEDSIILKTTNGGAEWLAPSIVSQGGLTLADIDCPDEDTCYAVSSGTFSSQQDGETPTGDGVVIKTSDGGETWSAGGSSQLPFPGDISCPARDTCYVEGDLGTIFKTVDGGESWSTPISETGLDLSHLHCLDEDNCVSIGPEGAIYMTDDGGSTWVARGAGADIDTIRALACPIDSSTCYALSFGAITKTTDGGASWFVWQKHEGDETSQLRALDCPDNDTCYAVSSSGVVYKTTDGGETMQGQFRRPELSGGLQDIDCPVSSDVCYAVGDRGTILKTTDGGASPQSGWEQLDSGTKSPVLDIQCLRDSEVCYALAGTFGFEQPSTILKTTDGGESWSTLLSETELGLSALHCLDDSSCYTLGESTIVKSDDGGETWSYQEIDPVDQEMDTPLAYIHCPVDSTTCYAIAFTFEMSEETIKPAGTVFKTGDGGQTWLPVYKADSLLTQVYCPVDSTACYAIALVFDLSDDAFMPFSNLVSSTVLKTSDGGNTWSAVYAADTEFTQVYCPVDSESCFLLAGGEFLELTGTGSSILKTDDGGESWSPLIAGYSEQLHDIHCLDELICYVLAGYGNILKSTDGGATWSLQYAGTSVRLSSISCLDAAICYAAGSGGTILKTTGGGEVGTEPPIAASLVGPIPTTTATAQPAPALPAFELSTFPVASQPVALAFDGQSIWVASVLGGALTNLGLDGTVLGTYTAPNASGLAFDGENIWVTLGGSGGRVSKWALDGTHLGTFSVGQSPRGLLFDGEKIWVANLDDPSVTQITLDGTVQDTFTGGAEPGSLVYESLAFDGQNIWLASSFSDIVTILSREGRNLGSFSVGSSPHYGIEFDGQSIWVTNFDSVTKLALDGTEIGTFDAAGFPQALLFDGESIWIAVEDSLTRLALDGTELNKFPVDGFARALAFDGRNLWIAGDVQFEGTITKLTVIEE